ncbi:MAG: metabolite traffic protein EboE [Chloroflexota bacterium]|nr:metabolite traffic protein EboE [Chloroflexota bacterium]
MRVGHAGQFHLTYCTNVHPGTSWQDMAASLQRHAPPLKERFAPDHPFGIGLRVSGDASKELLENNELQRFQAFLREHGLYVFTMNGFPYGPFHGQAVKEDVHAPDWRDPERVAYTRRLIDILAELLPEGMDGGISTSPLAYSAWVDENDDATWRLFVRHLVEIAAHLHEAHHRTGKFIHLDIEPEPDGLLGDCGDLVAFYKDWLRPHGADLLAQRICVPHDEAESLLLDYLRVCFDTCHVAVGYESPGNVLRDFQAHGIKVGKIQVSSAIKAELTGDQASRSAQADALRAFDEPTYLHQVVQRNADRSLTRYPDLGPALSAGVDEHAQEWRVHFHVPIFVDRYAEFASTQDTIRETFALLQEQPFTNHLEIETYTWDVLPRELKEDLLTSIGREYTWVLHALQ